VRNRCRQQYQAGARDECGIALGIRRRRRHGVAPSNDYFDRYANVADIGTRKGPPEHRRDREDRPYPRISV